MAIETTETDEMSDAFLAPDEEVTEETETTSETEESTDSVDEENEANPTALIPTSALGNKAKQGDTLTLRVVAIHDGEAEVEITSGKSKDTDKSETKTADEEIDSLAASY